MPLILAFSRLRQKQEDLCEFQASMGLSVKFQDSQDYTEKLSPEKHKRINNSLLLQ